MRLPGYILTKIWFHYAMNNERKVKPIHGILFLWCVEKNNRLDWREEYQLPTDEACSACGVVDRETFLKALKDLTDWGFINILQESKNRFTARYISLNWLELEKLATQFDLYHPKKSDAIPEAKSDAIPEASTSAMPTNKNNKTSKPKKQFIPPTIDEVIKYFQENGYTKDSAEKMFKSYSVADWIDSKGNPVKSWKQKAINVWFTEAHKTKSTIQLSIKNPADEQLKCLGL